MPIWPRKRRFAAIGGDHQRGAQSPRHSPGAPRRRPASTVRDFTAAGASNSRLAGRATARIQRGADMAVLGDMAQRRGAHFLRHRNAARRARPACPPCRRSPEFRGSAGRGLPGCPTPPAPSASAPWHRPGPRPGHRSWGPAPAPAGRHRPPATFRPPCASARPSGRPTMPPPLINTSACFTSKLSSCTKNSAKTGLLH